MNEVDRETTPTLATSTSCVPATRCCAAPAPLLYVCRVCRCHLFKTCTSYAVMFKTSSPASPSLSATRNNIPNDEEFSRLHKKKRCLGQTSRSCDDPMLLYGFMVPTGDIRVRLGEHHLKQVCRCKQRDMKKTTEGVTGKRKERNVGHNT